jgi:DNA modification methylase
MKKDLFGNPIIDDVLLRDRFIEPPFSVLDTKTGNWQRRKKDWFKVGIKSEVGRKKNMLKMSKTASLGKKDTSIFDPALCELLYKWFVPENGTILDPFAGGSVRGIVSNYLSFNYTGIDIRPEQVESNREQALDILDVNNQPQWYVGDSNKVLDGFDKEYDFVFSCPPYADLEVYSDLDGDISNMPYNKFMTAYEEIIAKSCKLLKRGSYACFVVGEVRDKKGHYIGFVPDTIKAFEKAGMKFYNEGILLNAIGTASLRAPRIFGSNKKLVKVHQNVLVFVKP